MLPSGICFEEQFLEILRHIDLPIKPLRKSRTAVARVNLTRISSASYRAGTSFLRTLPRVSMSITRTFAAAVLPLLFATAFAADNPSAKRPLQPQDFASIQRVDDPQLSPDGNWVAYTVHTVDLEENENRSDIWMASWDGSAQVQLTFTPDSESSARFSPDGKWLAFLSSRTHGKDSEKAGPGDDDGAQLWLMDRRGGEARRVTEVAGSIEDYAWSPDGKQLVLVMQDPEPQQTAAAVEVRRQDAPAGRRTDAAEAADDDEDPVPIVIDRYRFKSDEDRDLEHRRDHLYLFDVASKQLEPLTTGDFDDAGPAWSPDGT